MNQAETSPKPTVLVVPLDWGLGHATRCIPIIKALINNNCRVYLAGEGNVKKLLEKEFPFLPFLDLRGYRVHYSRKGWQLPISLMKQIPSLFRAINHEHKWLKEQVNKLSLNAVIADNRYGLYHSLIPGIFITHQLYIKTGLGVLFDFLLQKLNYRFINHFSECWVPDNKNVPNLANELSHPRKKPAIPLRYTGVLSRFKQLTSNNEGKHLLVLISGPEPQRSLFEQIIMEQIRSYKDSVIIIKGKPASSSLFLQTENLKIFDHLPVRQLEEIMAQASFVISRCGYSSVMDIIRMQKKSILIPTPGQEEQKYLSRHLMKNNLALCVDQVKFNLVRSLELAADFKYQTFSDNKNEIENIVADFVVG
ncbi:MAG TPA: glycosyltransferase, partial [Flavisolibacter sp.]|nr:glycosyltransferase [Flavisolibacter sp.]